VLKSILDKADLNDFYPIFEDSSPPLTAYFQNLDTITNPLRKKTVQHFAIELNEWSSPVDLIMRRMLEAFTDLPSEERNGIAQLLAYAYWFGVQEKVKNYGFQPLDKVLEKSKSYSLRCIENAKERGDSRRIQAETKLMEIFDVTKLITSEKNLGELLSLFENYSLEIKSLQSEILSLYGEPMPGARIFESFKEFHMCTLVGLEAAISIPSGNLKRQSLPPKYRYFFSYSEVWDEIVPAIISQFNTDETLANISSDFDIVTVIRKHARHLISLMDLPFKSKMFIFYVWGYPEIFDVSNRDFLPLFADWITALKEGNLDHRSWIFEEKTVLQVINAYKAVKKGTKPENGIIDLEPWTINDLYSFHPQGKDPEFWRQMLADINLRLRKMGQNKQLSRNITAVLDGAY
jgi:hypothetical protein